MSRLNVKKSSAGPSDLQGAQDENQKQKNIKTAIRNLRCQGNEIWARLRVLDFSLDRLAVSVQVPSTRWHCAAAQVQPVCYRPTPQLPEVCFPAGAWSAWSACTFPPSLSAAPSFVPALPHVVMFKCPEIPSPKPGSSQLPSRRRHNPAEYQDHSDEAFL